MAIQAQQTTVTAQPEFAAKLTLKQGDAWINSSQNTAKGFYKGLSGENPKAEANFLKLLTNDLTEYADCQNENISLYNQHNLGGFIGYRNEHGDLLDVKTFLKDIKGLKEENIFVRRDSDIVDMFE